MCLIHPLKAQIFVYLVMYGIDTADTLYQYTSFSLTINVIIL